MAMGHHLYGFGGAASLDDALQLYEEADKLIVNCQKRLTDAKRKIEVLVKNRSGDLVLGPDQKPTTQEMLNTTSEVEKSSI